MLVSTVPPTNQPINTDSNLDTWKGSFVSLFIPLVRPETRANVGSKITKWLATLFVLGLLQAHEPLIVSIETVTSLVEGGEASITRCRTGPLDLIQPILLFRIQLRQRLRKDLVELVIRNIRHGAKNLKKRNNKIWTGCV
jgi:hypothetical protein